MDNVKRRALAKARQATEWPTIQELADTYAIRYNVIREAIAVGEIEAFRLNVLRVNPDDFAEWLLARQNAINAR